MAQLKDLIVTGNAKLLNGLSVNGTIDGTSSSAEALTTSAGSNKQPVYFNNGKPVSINYTIETSVPANAKFTDTNTTYGAVTQSANGLMTAADKIKLDGIATGANAYTLPTASTTLGGVKTTSTITSTSGYTPIPIINGVPYYKESGSTFKDVYDLTIPLSAWKQDTTYSDNGYKYKADITISGVTSDMIPEVVLTPSSATLPIGTMTTTSTNTVSLYASYIPKDVISVTRISVRKNDKETITTIGTDYGTVNIANNVTTAESGFVLDARVGKYIWDNMFNFKDVLNISVPVSAWVEDSTYSYAGYTYKANITIEGVTSELIAEVVLTPSMSSDPIGEVATTSTNTVSIYALEKPTASVSISRISFRKMIVQKYQHSLQIRI